MNVPDRLTTERLALRRFVPADVEPFYAFMSDPDSTRYMAFTPEQTTREGVQAMMDAVIASYDGDEPIFVLAITLADDEQYIGSLGASPDPERDAVEIFYTLLPDYRGKGYATEGARRLVRYLVDEAGAERIVAYVFPANTASVRVAEKLGMRDGGEVVRDGHRGRVYVLEPGDPAD